MTNSVLEPVPSNFAGGSALASAKRLFLATRPKFFTASLLPVLVGFAWGYRAGGAVDMLVLVLALLATAAVHAASNVFNDVGDDINGSDPGNSERIHPFTGGSRFIQNGVMTRAQMLRFSLYLFALAVVLGGALVAIKGVTVLWLGLAGIALGLFYSMPVVQLVARGIGELAVAVAFGVLPVSGAAWLATGRFDTTVLWLSVTVGLWVAAILQINEVPDITADAAAGKRTMAVRLGARGVAILYGLMHVVAFAILAALAYRGDLPALILLLPAVLMAVGLKAATGIAPFVADKIVVSIKMTLAIQLLGCAWLTGALALMP